MNGYTPGFPGFPNSRLKNNNCAHEKKPAQATRRTSREQYIVGGAKDIKLRKWTLYQKATRHNEKLELIVPGV